MPAPSSSPSRNKLLAALSSGDLGLLQSHLTRVTLKLRQDLEKPNRRIDDIYFMDAGIASVVAVQPGETRIEVGLIGSEGMSGSVVVLGDEQSPHSTYMQVAGEGRRIRSDKLRGAMKASETMRDLLLKYVQAFHVQTTHTAIANARAKLDARLARWILMAHDRVRADKLPLTHEFLALMLGVRRAGVTEALHSLARRRLIEAGRGHIVVLDRKGIEQVAGTLYGVPEAEFQRLIG